MRGYSLIELLIALAISAILGSFALPVFHQQTSALLLQQEAGRWLSYLQHVQAKAKVNEENIALNLSALDGITKSPVVATEATYSNSIPLTFHGASATATPGHIKLFTSEKQVKVIISNIGRIRTCQNEGSALTGIPAC